MKQSGKSTVFQQQTIITEHIAVTAGNSTCSLTVPAGKRWLMLGGTIGLETNATVGNRYVYMDVKGATAKRRFRIISKVAQVANKDYDHMFVPQLPSASAIIEVGDRGFLEIGIPYPLILDTASTLIFGVLGGFAGDSFYSTAAMGLGLEFLEVDL